MRKWASKNPDKNFEQSETYHNVKEVQTPKSPDFDDTPNVGKKKGAMRGTGAAIRGTSMSENTQ